MSFCYLFFLCALFSKKLQFFAEREIKEPSLFVWESIFILRRCMWRWYLFVRNMFCNYLFFRCNVINGVNATMGFYTLLNPCCSAPICNAKSKIVCGSVFCVDELSLVSIWNWDWYLFCVDQWKLVEIVIFIAITFWNCTHFWCLRHHPRNQITKHLNLCTIPETSP